MITDFYVKIKTEKPFLCLLLTNIVVMHKYKSKRKAPPYLRKARGHGVPSHIQLRLIPSENLAYASSSEDFFTST